MNEAEESLEELNYINVDSLTYEYKIGNNVLRALSKVCLEVNEGQFVSIIGPSGSGKTTLLKIIGGLQFPTSGTVTISGSSPIEAQRRRAIGFVFQDPSLLPWSTVFQNVQLPLRLNPVDNATKIDVEVMLDRVGLADFRNYYPHQLSSGMKQRVALARSMIFNPDVLLMDEPFSDLDEITRATMQYELLRIWEGTRLTVIMVTHSIHEAVIMSDRVHVLSTLPGKFVHDVKIDIPRPRSVTCELKEPFLSYVKEIKEVLSTQKPNQ